MKEKAVIEIEKKRDNKQSDQQTTKKRRISSWNCFGKGLEAFSIKLKESELRKSITKFGRNYLYTLDLDGKETYTVMLKDIQQAPLTNRILNVSFHQISLTEEVRTNLDIRLIGREAVEHKGLLVLRQLEIIPVKGLPQDIPDYIEIDITNLELGDQITVADVNYPKGIAADIEKDQIVLLIKDPVVNAQAEDTNEEIAKDSSVGSDDKEEA